MTKKHYETTYYLRAVIEVWKSELQRETVKLSCYKFSE